MGYQYSPNSHALKDFLSGNLIPYQWLDYNQDETAQELMQLSGLAGTDLPVVFFEDGSRLVNPKMVDKF